MVPCFAWGQIKVLGLHAFVDYWLRLKNAELQRFHAEVSEWEQREYFASF